jgi:hypothetical protein
MIVPFCYVSIHAVYVYFWVTLEAQVWPDQKKSCHQIS